MLVEIIISLFIGILIGIFTGLIPGIHINLIGAFIITLISSFYLNPIYAIVFIVSLAVTHTFIDFIPSIFLGCPDTDTELSVLPGHELLKLKRGYEAIYLSNIGSIIAIILTGIILIPSLFLIEKFYSAIFSFIPYILIFISIILILTEKKKWSALFVFLLTGVLGITASTLTLNQPLLPLLTGLFGVSGIIISLKNNVNIPSQIITKPRVRIAKPILSALIGAPLCSFLPGVGSGQAAIIGNTIIRNSRKQFIVLLGIVNTLVMTFSFISLFILSKTRTGAAASIKEIIGTLNTNHFILIIITVLISGIVAYFLTLFLAKYFALKLKNINYRKLSLITLAILFIVVFIISGFLGIIILIISSLTGIYSIELNVRRSNMMGVLILGTIFWLI